MRPSITRKVATITAAAFILLAITTLTIVTTFSVANAGSSVRVTQSNNGGDGTNSVRVTQSNNDGTSSVIVQSDDEGLEVNCEGDVNCEVIGDDTVVATSEDGDSVSTTAVNTTTADATTVNELSNDLDGAVDDELDDLGERIERMVDQILDNVSSSLASWRMSVFT
jgi:hypothetical protein